MTTPPHQFESQAPHVDAIEINVSNFLSHTIQPAQQAFVFPTKNPSKNQCGQLRKA